MAILKPSVFLSFSLAFMLQISGAALQAQSPYRLVIVAKGGQVIGGNTLNFVASRPVINNNGNIAFEASDTGPGGAALYTVVGPILRLGDTVAGVQMASGFSFAALNDNNTVAFLSMDANTQAWGMFRASLGGPPGALLLQIGATIDGLTLTSFAPPVINDLGAVLFAASDAKGGGFFTPSHVVAHAGETIDGHLLAGVGPAILSNNGVVNFMSTYPGGNGIFTGTKATVLSGQTIAGLLITAVSGLAADSFGNPFFLGVIPGGVGVFTPTSLVVRTGTVIDGNEITTMDNLSVNTLGTVSFISGILSGGYGVFTQRNVVAKIGDIVQGHTITSIEPPVMNNSGDIAFWAAFADGNAGIVLATIPRNLHVTPKSGIYLNQKVGTISSARFVRVANTTSQPVTISNVHMTGPFLPFTNCPATLPAGAQCLISVVFAPSAAGAQVGQLVFSAQGDVYPYVITLSGLAIP